MHSCIFVTGTVVQGARIGRKIGFPTANIIPDKKIPEELKYGVYAVKVEYNSKVFNGMANYGFRPTMEQQNLTLEVNIFDFDEDIYGKRITVKFIKYIRNEKKFNGPDELKIQIESDKQFIRKILSAHMQPDANTE